MVTYFTEVFRCEGELHVARISAAILVLIGLIRLPVHKHLYNQDWIVEWQALNKNSKTSY